MVCPSGPESRLEGRRRPRSRREVKTLAEISENSCGTHEGMGSIGGSTPRFRQRYGNRAVVERAVGTIQLGGDPDDSVRDESVYSQA